MKTIFRFLSVTMLFAAVASSTLAQDTPAAAPAGDVCTEPAAEQQYNKFVEGYKKTTEAEVKDAISTGKGFLEKYGSCANWKEQVDFVKPQTERLERVLAGIYKGKKFDEFDAAVKAENTEKIYSLGKELLAAEPDNLNVMVTLGLAGGKAVAKKDNRFNEDTIRYANMALPLVKGKTSEELFKMVNGKKVTDRVGAYQYEDTRENTISKLTYMPGYISYYGKNDKKAAMSVFYETIQLPGTHKDAAYIYNAIGEFYLESRTPIGTEIQDLIKKLEAAPAAEKEAIDLQIKPKVALFNGYTERALDAFGRAHKTAKVDTPQGKEFKAAVYKIIQGLYEQRFPDKKDGMDAWISTTTAKPLPNPTSAVTPVEDPAPATTTGGGVGAANGTGVGAANGTGVGAANGTGIGAASGKTVGGATKPATSGTAKPAASGSTTAKAKPKNRR